MSRDPIIDEVRQVRHQIEADCTDDPQKYYEHIQKIQQKYRNRLVQRKPKTVPKKDKIAI